ncbi:probable ATP-dependent RNA helicase DDX52 [Anoplophora glabripennis]|uniref:probable ATP-dependent RNA helicase DDX52 n=1 Tax=Anoplophora glabripennis TaxID=217634 RepID=UPI000873A60B|nr:probable ATP-dependent RNA helicase DDX52 [Anoplophora glabripennis]
MDAYDIFKKLTRGAKFSKKSNVKLEKKQLNEDIKIKVEKEEETCKKSNTLSRKEQNPITLLSGLNPTEKKGKKRKNDAHHSEQKTKILKIEEINHYRNINNINVVGRHVPEPAKSFDEFKVDEDIIENLKKCGYEEPTPIQKQAVPLMLEGRQILGCAPTGSGKTAAFLVPIIQTLNGPRREGFRALILCPTRELAKQTQRECVRLSEGRGFRIHVISKIKQALTQYGPKSSKKFDILITTPNRICYLSKQDPPAISLTNIQWLVIDEADKLFESGNRGFWDQLSEILTACNGENRKIAMFSATYTPAVAKWCVHNMKGLVRVTVGQRNSATDLVDQELLFVGNEQGKLLALRDIIRAGISPPVLIFVQSKERAQQLFNELIYDGINVDAIHADRTQLQRDNTVRSFREGQIWVLICTELMARGVDFKGVNLVINYDYPSSAISYIHRIGRAGRAGRRGKAVTFFTTGDTVNLRSIAHVLKQSGCKVPPYMLTMKKKSRKERKQLEKSAPKRDEIITKPIYERKKWKRHKKKKE